MPLFEEYSSLKNQNKGPVQPDTSGGNGSRKRRIWTEDLEGDKALFTTDTKTIQSQHSTDTNHRDSHPSSSSRLNPDTVQMESNACTSKIKDGPALLSQSSDTKATQNQHRSDTNLNKSSVAKLPSSLLKSESNIDDPSKASKSLKELLSSATSQVNDTIPTQALQKKNTSALTDLTGNEIKLHQSAPRGDASKIIAPAQKNLSPNTDTKPTHSRHNTNTSSPDSIHNPNQIDHAHQKDTPSKVQNEENRLLATDTIPTHKQHKASTNATHNPAQNPHKTDTNHTQLESKLTQNQHNTDTIATHIPAQKQHNSDTQSDTNIGRKNNDEIIYSLRGNNLRLLNAVYSLCISNGEYRISKITYEYLAEMAQVPIGSIRTTAKRLKQMGLIDITSKAKGRGAYIDIKIFSEIKDILTKQILLSNTDTIASQYRHTTRHNTNTQSDTNFCSSSSSFNINKNTTTTVNEDAEWEQISIPQTLKSLQFGSQIIKQVRERNLLTPEELQESFNAFAFDIDQNDILKTKKINSATGYFMGITNRKTKYVPPSNYYSDEDKAIEENKSRLEELKRKREDVERLKAELLFEEWINSLSDDDKITIVPEDEYFKVGTPFHTQMLRAHFEKSSKKGIAFENPSLSQ